MLDETQEPQQVAINFKVSARLADRLRHTARLKSLQERRSVSVGSLVREAVEAAYQMTDVSGQPTQAE